MTSFEGRDKAAELTREIFELIDEQYLYENIDKSIEEAAAGFTFETKAAMTHPDFIHVIGAFIRHIHKNGFRIHQEISDDQARAEAVALLEKHYRSPYSSGYDAAFLHLANSKWVGIEYILTQLMEIIKTTAREKHINWVYLSRIAPLDWPTRCQIAEILIERWSPFLPSAIKQFSTAQSAHHLPELINSMRFADGKVRKIQHADFD
jgi:hypothetical protein